MDKFIPFYAFGTTINLLILGTVIYNAKVNIRSILGARLYSKDGST